MSKTMHILNGDSAISSFNKSDIQGDFFVWREVLADGPINHDFNSEEFWAERDLYLSKAFDIPQGEYAKTIKGAFQEFLKEIDDYTEICLWFEYDLFCQINMIGLISFLGQVCPKNMQLTLVCAGHIDESDKLFGLGELSPEQFTQLFDSRLKMGSREVDYAQEVFETYCSQDAEALYTYILMPFNEFKYLSLALEAHMKRFPYSDSGLNEIEQKVVELIKAGLKNSNQIVGQLLQWQKYYGFGDLQYFNILDGMKPLFEDFENFQLKDDLSLGKMDNLLNRNQQLGGAWLKEWVYDVNEKTLAQSSQRF